MSASLVGSEMCIRDRHWKAPKSFRRLRKAPRSIGELRRARRAREASRACLLYTSDAADDM
eukprot:14928322-Alexandrium_andersonii.AAC.1